MLHIRFERSPNTFLGASKYFDYHFEEAWFDDPLVRQIIQDIDKSTVVMGCVIRSPVLGIMPPQWLSNGAKTLILMLKEPWHEFNATSIGDNCGPWIIKIGHLHDITIVCTRIFRFHPPQEKDVADMNAVCDFNGMKIDSMVDYLDAYGDYVMKTE